MPNSSQPLLSNLCVLQEKQKLKEEREAAEAKYKYALVDGNQEPVGNFRVEPPGLFRGRGEHPKMGKLKARIYPRDITINIGKNVPIPEHPYKDQECVASSFLGCLICGSAFHACLQDTCSELLSAAVLMELIACILGAGRPAQISLNTNMFCMTCQAALPRRQGCLSAIEIHVRAAGRRCGMTTR